MNGSEDGRLVLKKKRRDRRRGERSAIQKLEPTSLGRLGYLEQDSVVERGRAAVSFTLGRAALGRSKVDSILAATVAISCFNMRRVNQQGSIGRVSNLRTGCRRGSRMNWPTRSRWSVGVAVKINASAELHQRFAGDQRASCANGAWWQSSRRSAGQSERALRFYELIYPAKFQPRACGDRDGPLFVSRRVQGLLIDEESKAALPAVSQNFLAGFYEETRGAGMNESVLQGRLERCRKLRKTILESVSGARRTLSRQRCAFAFEVFGLLAGWRAGGRR